MKSVPLHFNLELEQSCSKIQEFLFENTVIEIFITTSKCKPLYSSKNIQILRHVGMQHGILAP